MKYLEVPELSRLAQALSHDGPECAVHARIEAYSCKNINRDKKLFKALENAYSDDLANSQPLPPWLDPAEGSPTSPEESPFGPITKSASRKTLYLLIATLNIAFPDHEFSDVRPSQFCREPSGAAVLNSLSTALEAPRTTYSFYPPPPAPLSSSPEFFPQSVPTKSSVRPLRSPCSPPPIIAGTHPALYACLDNAIGVADCEVYSYTPDIDSDPHAEDYDESEEEAGSEESSDEDDVDDESPNGMFEFDDYDVDEARHDSDGGGRWPSKLGGSPPSPRTALYNSVGRYSTPHKRHRRGGAMLWSSHWFFLNRKLKRILFITVWARTKGRAAWTADFEDMAYEFKGEKEERFLGWEGAVGAGARAMGLV